MTAMAADVGQVYAFKTVTRDCYDFWVSVAIGAAGAVGTTTVDDPQIVLTRTAPATYTITYPAGQRAQLYGWELLAADATPTAASFIVTAKSATAGTATIVAVNGTAAAEIESGSTLSFFIRVATRQ